MLRVLLYGHCFETWDMAVQKMFRENNLSVSEAALQQCLMKCMKTTGEFYCQPIKPDCQMTVLRDPKKISNWIEIKAWLRWWTTQLEKNQDRTITAIFSPSDEYDPLVKIVAKSDGLYERIVSSNARATLKIKEYKEDLARLERYRQMMNPGELGLDDEQSSGVNSPEESGEESETGKENKPKNNKAQNGTSTSPN